MFRHFWIMFPMFGGDRDTKKQDSGVRNPVQRVRVRRLFCGFQRLDAIENHPLFAAVDDFGHLFSGREVFRRQRFAQFRGETAAVPGDPLPFRGNQSGCAQRFEQQRQQLVVRRLQRFLELAGQQSGNLRFGRVAFEDADSVDVFGQHCDLPVGQARAEIGGSKPVRLRWAARRFSA